MVCIGQAVCLRSGARSTVRSEGGMPPGRQIMNFVANRYRIACFGGLDAEGRRYGLLPSSRERRDLLLPEGHEIHVQRVRVLSQSTRVLPISERLRHRPPDEGGKALPMRGAGRNPSGAGSAEKIEGYGMTNLGPVIIRIV